VASASFPYPRTPALEVPVYLILLFLIPLLLIVADLYRGLCSRLRPVAFFVLVVVSALVANLMFAGPANAQFIDSAQSFFYKTNSVTGDAFSIGITGLKFIYIGYFAIYLCGISRTKLQNLFNRRS
jgi:hypothetical protein